MTVLNEADAMYVGGNSVDKLFLGTNLVWELTTPGGQSYSDDFNDLPDNDYLYQRSTWRSNKSAPHAMRSDTHSWTDGSQVLDGSDKMSSPEYALFRSPLDTPDHSVSLEVFPDAEFDSTPSEETILGVVARASAEDDADDCYWAGAVAGGGFPRGIYLFERSAGVSNDIGFWATSFDDETVFEIVLLCNGSTISVDVDGTERISLTDTTHTTGNYAGIIFQRGEAASDAQPWLDNWAAADII